MKSKICGIMSLRDARMVENAGGGSIGLVTKGRNYCTIAIPGAKKIVEQIPIFFSSTMVTHETNLQVLIEQALSILPTEIQLVEDMPLDEIALLKKIVYWAKIIKTVPVTGEESIQYAKKFEGRVDALLLDSEENGIIGAVGKPHDWKISRKIVDGISMPVILAGGLTPENVAEGIETVQPFAVDVLSGVRKNLREIDPEKTKKFIQIAKKYDFGNEFKEKELELILEKEWIGPGGNRTRD